MATQYESITPKLQAFIEQQKIFFVATGVTEGRINLSPKGMDSLRVISPNRVIWLNVTGSGNETAAHVLQNPRMTIMMTAFEGNPMILRIYGKSKAIHQSDEEWDELYAHLPSNPGARQIFDVDVEMVQTSCGMATPLYKYLGERELLNVWATTKGEVGIRKYWQDKNRVSIDGLPTGIDED